MIFSTAQVLLMARALSDRGAALCNVDALDSWKTYHEDYIADVRAMLEAIGATVE